MSRPLTVIVLYVVLLAWAAPALAASGGHLEGYVPAVAKVLCAVADRYYQAAEAELSTTGKGRPAFRADKVFVQDMARVYAEWSGRDDFGWRRFRRGNSHHALGMRPPVPETLLEKPLQGGTAQGG